MCLSLCSTFSTAPRPPPTGAFFAESADVAELAKHDSVLSALERAGAEEEAERQRQGKYDAALRRANEAMTHNLARSSSTASSGGRRLVVIDREPVHPWSLRRDDELSERTLRQRRRKDDQEEPTQQTEQLKARRRSTDQERRAQRRRLEVVMKGSVKVWSPIIFQKFQNRSDLHWLFRP